MKRKRYKFKKKYLIFLISIFIFRDVFTGIVSTTYATTKKSEKFFEQKVQGNIPSDINIEQIPEENILNKNNIISDEDMLASGISGTCEWEIDSEGVLHIREGALYSAGSSIWASYSSSIEKIVFEGRVIAPSNSGNLFLGLSKVKTIENLSNLDTSQVTNMSGMFNTMTSLVSLDLSSFDTSKVTDMTGMFNAMTSLVSLDLSSFDTSKVTKMGTMFGDTRSLVSLDLSSFDTSEVTYMVGLFQGASALVSLDLSSFNTSKVTDMNAMFRRGSSLVSLDLSSFDTSQVTNMSNMFDMMTSLVSLNLSSFDTSKVTNMSNFLRNADNLSEFTLGPKVKSISSVKLPAIEVTDIYEGTWRNIGTGTAAYPKGNNIWTSTEFMENYNESYADTYVWKKIELLEVKTKTADIALGTNLSDINPNEFIESVTLGDVELSKNEYTVKIKNSPNTTRIGNPEFSLEIIPGYDPSLTQNVKVSSNILWGSTLVVKNNGLSAVDASISLLHKEGAPYLNANQGSGFSATNITSRSDFYIYRSNTSNRVIRFFYGTVNNSPTTLANNWNTIFKDSSLQYGDVLVGYVGKYTTSIGGWNGQNTFISRNNTLITETVGYDYAYYELTPSGYHLLRLNQLAVNNNQKVKLNTSKEEMNKDISNFISLPEHIENSNDFRMEFESVDTASPGNKKSTINVYETLESGGEFKTTYEVAYTVYPEITESYYDVDGKQIEQSQTTEFEYGKEFTPNPEKYIENDGELYIYKGWVDELPVTGTIIPQEGIPAPTLIEKNYDYYYIYEKADKFINVTVPTEVVFGTFENNNKISSKAYEIKNNSDEIPLEISLEQFDKVKSDIKLLSSNTPDPIQEEASAKLNLHVDNENVISGLTEDTPTQIITKIETSASRFISLEGTYFGNMRDKNILDYKMHLKFKATRDNKN